MATVVRNTDPSLPILCAAINSIKAQIGAGSSYHLDAYERPVTAANATDLPTLLTLVNELRGSSLVQRADTLAHKVVDATTIAAPAATDLATAITLMNELKADFNVHAVSLTYHYTVDTVIATADGTILADTITLANAFKTKINAHTASAPAGASLRLVGL